jgi:hypothetical protein
VKEKEISRYTDHDNPPKPVSMGEAERLLSECEWVYGWMYDHNLRIVPA